MAVQFAPPSPRKGFGASLGEALGQGLSGLGTGLGSGFGQGLQLLAQNKLNSLHQRETAQRLAPAYQQLGFTPEEASSIAALPDAIQKEIISQKLKQPQEQAYLSALQSLLGGGPMASPESKAVTDQGIGGAPGLSAILGGGGAGLTANQATKIADLAIKTQAQKTKEALQSRKEAFQKEQFTQKQKASAFKETKPERTEILNTAKAAKDSIKRLDRMQELSREGKLSNPLYLKSLEKIGFDIPALKTPQSQEFEKLSIDFLRDARQIFGSRVTNLDVSTFLKGIPTLSQSPEGRERVIRNLKLFNEGSVAREQALKEVMAENNNVPPLDVASKVEEKAAPKLDQLAAEFKQGESPKITNVGQRFSALPEPSTVPIGTEITNKITGSKKRNTGTEWVDV